MINRAIPADIVLHIFSYLPLSDVCLLMKKTRNSDPLLQFFLKRDLLARVKREEWDIVLHSPANYFAILCNRHVSTLVKPIAELTCTGYNSQSEYLRFETLNSYEMEISDEEIEFQSIRIYCSQWFNLFKEDDTKNVQIKLVWRQGDQTKQIGDMFINYKCTEKESAEGCDQCKYYHRCRRHAFLSTPTNTKLKILQIQSIHVSLNWLQQGLIF